MLVIILFAALFLYLQMSIFQRASVLSDGYSYFDAWETIKGGHTDRLRTPVYAMLVGFLTELFGKDTALVIIPVIHWIIYIAALRAVWQIDNWIGISHWINCAVILTLVTVPGFWVFNHITMAETFSTCGIILLIWLSGRYLLGGEKSTLYCAGFTMVILIFTKPMFIFLIPVMALFWLIVCRRNRRHLIAAGISVTASTCMTAIYIYCMAHTYLVPSLSIATTYNQYYCMRAEGLIIPDEIDNSDLRERFQPLYDSIPGGWYKTQPYWQEMWMFNWPDLDVLAKTAINHHPEKVLAATAQRFRTSLSTSQFYSLVDELGLSPEYDRMYANWNGIDHNREGGFIYPFHRLIRFPIWGGLVILSVFAIIWSYRWRRQHRLPALPALIATIYLTAYITTVIGAHDSWGRILTPVNPLLVMMAGSIASIIHSLQLKSKSLDERHKLKTTIPH